MNQNFPNFNNKMYLNVSKNGVLQIKDLIQIVVDTRVELPWIPIDENRFFMDPIDENRFFMDPIDENRFFMDPIDEN